VDFSCHVAVLAWLDGGYGGINCFNVLANSSLGPVEGRTFSEQFPWSLLCFDLALIWSCGVAL
jgi:hypothetical protein